MFGGLLLPCLLFYQFLDFCEFSYPDVSGFLDGDGALLGDFKAEASGIGPAIMWIPPKYEGEVALVAKWLSEYDSENRIDGDHVFLSFMMTF